MGELQIKLYNYDITPIPGNTPTEELWLRPAQLKINPAPGGSNNILKTM